MPLLNVAVPPLAVATRSFSVLCPCHQCNSDHFVAFALLYISAQCLRYAIQGSAKPLLLNTNHRNTLAIQLISIHRHCGSNRLCAKQSLCPASLCSALPLQFTSWHCSSLPSHYISMLFAALAILYISSPCLCLAILSLLHYAVAIHVVALPWPFFAPPTPALPLPCNATPLRRILRCSASFWFSKYGPCVPVPPRPGVAASARRCTRC